MVNTLLRMNIQYKAKIAGNVYICAQMQILGIHITVIRSFSLFKLGLEEFCVYV